MSYIFGQGTPWTYDQLQQKRKIAEQITSGMGTPRNVGEGLNAIGDALLVRGINKRAEKEEARMRQEADALWSQVSGGGNIPAIVSALSNPMIANDPGRSMFLRSQFERANQPPPDPYEAEMNAIRLDRERLELDRLRNPAPGYTLLTPEEEEQFGLDPALAYQRGADGKISAIGGGGTSVTVNNAAEGGVPADEEELRKKLGAEEGTQWAGMLGQGNKAASVMGDLDLMEELVTMAPQGPIVGRLAGAFPGVNSAADALKSVVSRIAPTLRVEGSGSTSDVEYNGMLASLPQLSARPEANVAIIGMMRAKAQIDMERANVVAQYQNNQITAPEARQKLAEINSRSIMTPELRAAISGLSPQEAPQDAPQAAPAAPSGPRQPIDFKSMTADDVGQYDISTMTPEEVRAYIARMKELGFE